MHHKFRGKIQIEIKYMTFYQLKKKEHTLPLFASET